MRKLHIDKRTGGGGGSLPVAELLVPFRAAAESSEGSSRSTSRMRSRRLPVGIVAGGSVGATSPDGPGAWSSAASGSDASLRTKAGSGGSAGPSVDIVRISARR